MRTPEKALDALATPGKVTLGQVALLEKIDSPLLKDCGLLAYETIPSLYLLTLPASEGVAHMGTLQADAFAWADTLTTEQYGTLQQEALAALRAFFGMLPEPEGDAPKKESPATVG